MTRPVDVNGHNVFWKGYFHQFMDGKTALIEDEQGNLNRVDLKMYSLKFTTPCDCREKGG